MFSSKVKPVPLGAYGDPAAVPLDVWRWVTKHAASWTGYTHQWRTCHPSYRFFCMASVETLNDRQLAQSMGWRTFRIRSPEQERAPGELVCPASVEAGHRADCVTCKACAGVDGRSLDVVIIAHGLPWKLQQLATLTEQP